MDKKILVLIGNARRHIYFAKQIHDKYPLSGIIVEKKYSAKNRLRNLLKKINYNTIELLRKVFYKLVLAGIDARYKKSEIDILLGGKKNIDLPECRPVRL